MAAWLVRVFHPKYKGHYPKMLMLTLPLENGSIFICRKAWRGGGGDRLCYKSAGLDWTVPDIECFNLALGVGRGSGEEAEVSQAREFQHIALLA